MLCGGDGYLSHDLREGYGNLMLMSCIGVKIMFIYSIKGGRKLL